MPKCNTNVNNIFQDITDQNMGPIEPSRDNVRQDPYTLPKGFEWDTMDVSKNLSSGSIV